MAFNISDFFVNEENAKEGKKDFKVRKIHISKLHPATEKENFYHMDDEEVELVARTIEMVGIQQNSVVKPIADTDEFEIVVGHKRYYAHLKLVAEGKTEYEYIPCKVEDTGDDIRNELILIFTNSTQRDRNDFEKIKEIQRIKALLGEYLVRGGELKGKKRDILAAILRTSKSKIGRLENIANNLIDDFMKAFEAGEINVSTANEIAGMSKEAQIAMFDTFKQTGKLRQEDVKVAKEPENKPKMNCKAAGEKKIVEIGIEDFEPDPDKIVSICYSCLHWDECDQKSNTVANCKDYINKQEALKTDEQKQQDEYDRQQELIDKQTQKALQEKADQEKLDKLPSKKEKKVHELRVSYLDFMLITKQMKRFMIVKDKGYDEDDQIRLIEYSKGSATGNELTVTIKYLEKNHSGLKDDYCVVELAIKQ